MDDAIQEHLIFPTTIYTANASQFKDDIEVFVSRHEMHGENDTKILQSENLIFDDRLNPFMQFTVDAAWSILNSQGYNMQNKTTRIQEIWLQSYFEDSYMPHHVHGNGCQITGFYFIKVPKCGAKVIFHDPRPGKVQINLPEINSTDLTQASTMANFNAVEGQLMLTNAWLPHSVAPFRANFALRMLHINIMVEPKALPVEIV